MLRRRIGNRATEVLNPIMCAGLPGNMGLTIPAVVFRIPTDDQ
jgi:hypothetical protein